MRKKILFLDANITLINSIIYAKGIGCYTITCDNKPNNPGHSYSDKQYFISTYDIDKIYKVVEDEKIDGVVYFSSAHGLYAACRIIEKYSLPGFPLSIEETISDKYKFRQFLKKNGLNVPENICVNSSMDSNLNLLSNFSFPLIVKPVDAGGNRGITKVETQTDIPNAIDYALTESISKKVIIEEFIESDLQINGDCLFVNGKLIYSYLGQHLYSNSQSILPYATIFGKNIIADYIKKDADEEIQKIITINKLRNGILNVELRVDRNGRIFFIEINPRHSGNRLYSLMNKEINIPMENIAVDIALNNYDFINKFKVVSHNYAAYCLIYSDKDGVLETINISDDLNKYVVSSDFFKSKGDYVKKFTLLKERLGILHLIFPNEKDLKDTFNNINNLYKVNLR